MAEAFFAAIRSQAEAHKLLSREHFSGDGTLLEAAAALKSLLPIDEDEEPPAGGGRNPDVDWRGERRVNLSHRSTTDPEARLARKGNGREARLCYAGHASPRTATGSSSRPSSRKPAAPQSARSACGSWLASVAAAPVARRLSPASADGSASPEAMMEALMADRIGGHDG